MKYLLILITLLIFCSCDNINPEAKDTDTIPKSVYQVASERNMALDSGQLFRVTSESKDYYFIAAKPVPVLKYKYDLENSSIFLLVLMLIIIFLLFLLMIVA